MTEINPSPPFFQAETPLQSVKQEKPKGRHAVSLAVGWLPSVLIINPFSGLSEEDRYVAPHPDDIAKKGSWTNPIELISNYPVQYYSGFYSLLGVDLSSVFSLRNRFSYLPFLPSYSYCDETGGCYNNPYNEGAYQYPPINRQKYASGEDAYTFISVGAALMNDLSLAATLRFEGYECEQRRVDLEGGFNITGIQHLYGYDRYTEVEFADKQYHYSPGLHVGAHYSCDVNEHFSYAILGLSASIGLMKEPVQVYALDLLGVEGRF